MLQTITWTGAAARLLDQTRLPTETAYLDITDERQMWDAIKRLVIRGAPAIGVAAAFGVYLGIRDFPETEGDLTGFRNRIENVCAYLKTARPTAVNLAWAVERIRHYLFDRKYRATPPRLIRLLKQRALKECKAMLAEDNRICRSIGEHGYRHLQSILKNSAAGQPINLLTHCNAGGLATVRYGTALAPVYVGTEFGQSFHVYADETRPLLQGSRITAFELQQNGIPVTVICDNMAATVMQQGKVQAVIVGTDRVAANGDVANKIGTLGVAILAQHFNIPFLVAAPTSSIDLSLPTGAQIPIEQRSPEEISRGFGKITAPKNVDIFNPAFDVTPSNLVTAIITENGVANAPYSDSLAKLCRRQGN
jgi:methylthioribose-1-phosphate isomerase